MREVLQLCVLKHNATNNSIFMQLPDYPRGTFCYIVVSLLFKMCLCQDVYTVNIHYMNYVSIKNMFFFCLFVFCLFFHFIHHHVFLQCLLCVIEMKYVLLS